MEKVLLLNSSCRVWPKWTCTQFRINMVRLDVGISMSEEGAAYNLYSIGYF